MEKEFVPYKESLELKQLGFDEPCFGHYLMKKFYLKEYHKQSEGITLRPTFSQAFRWFREKYELFNKIDTKVSRDIRYSIYSNDEEIYVDSCYWNYEEAELECLTKLIEIAKK